MNRRILSVSLVFVSLAVSWPLGDRACAQERLLSLLESHCLHCHDSSTTEGEFDLTPLLHGKLDDASAARHLELISARVVANEMPPKDDSTLKDQERQTFVSKLRSRLDVLAEKLQDDPDNVAMARLTPYEFRNIIRDLSDDIVDDAGRFLPNEGGAGEGFANVGAAQAMTLPQYEKYVDAVKDALDHLRVYPVSGNAIQWSDFPRSPVDKPAESRKEVSDEIIAWYVAQQQKWGEEHRNELQEAVGFVHSAYLEAAWRYANRDDKGQSIEDFAWTYRRLQPTDHQHARGQHDAAETIALAPVALKKWWDILNREDTRSPHAVWAASWQKLASQQDVTPRELRTRCTAIVTGNEKVVVETEDYAPPYEISFHEAKEEVLEAAEKRGHWPFRIDIGAAKELFLVVTDAGDGGRGEYAVWSGGRFVFKDGSSKPWQDAVTIIGANSGRVYPFGFDGENAQTLGKAAVGAKPPGTLKFTVPKDAIVFEVDLALDTARTKLASIQALVLKQKPKSQSYVPGRFVFGGKKRPVTASAKLKQEHQRALRKRNVSEANKTKVGLNAERNVFANWNRTPIEAIGGPWPEHEPDKSEPEFPYHYTAEQVLQNATDSDLANLRLLEDRLVSLVDDRDEGELAMHARAIVRSIARRAWRRPLRESEANALMKLYEESRRLGFSFDSSVKSSLLAVLASPNFLYKLPVTSRVRSDDDLAPAAGSHRYEELSSHALASRSSFFLWASIPDEELSRLAEQDKLRDPQTLREQAKRMLHDKRAHSLAIDFAGQLWGFNDFDSFNNPDTERFEEFTPELRRSMLNEVHAFFADIMQNDRPLTNLLDADYTFANERLANHYGLTYPPHTAAESGIDHGAAAGIHHYIKLPPNRGGLATMGLFLTKTSLPLRTSPVQRGVWVMESLLGRHLPNPPPNVPSLSEDDTDEAGLNIRQQLERHRADASCASCHDKIDPLGISLEEFDAIGRWRDEERDGTKLATTATTHDGIVLHGAASLKSYLIDHQTEFIDHFNRKLLGYALGRSIHIGDRALLDRMQHRLEKEEFRFSVLVDEIVQSKQFRMKRVDDE